MAVLCAVIESLVQLLIKAGRDLTFGGTIGLSLSAMILLSTKPQRFISLIKGRFAARAPDRPIRNVHATFQHQLLDLAQAQVEPGAEPDNKSNDRVQKWSTGSLFLSSILLLVYPS